jgi:hypothetical protein
MGAGPTGRITYAAEGRLDGIGRRAIGDMVSSAVASSYEVALVGLKERPSPSIIARDRGPRKSCGITISGWPAEAFLAHPRTGIIRP